MDASIDSCDYVTLVISDEPCNKLYQLDTKLNVRKIPAQPLSCGTAQTIHVPHQEKLVEVLNHIQNRDDCLLILGYIPDTVGLKCYKLLSKNKLKSYSGNLKPYTRTKDNFIQSNWFLFDHDQDKQTPSNLQYKTLAEVDKALLKMVPGIDGYIRTASNSSRVIVDGNCYYTGSNCHYFVQAKDATDVTRFGKALLVHAHVNSGHGFMKKRYSKVDGSVCGQVAWCVFDPSTYSPERLVYEGSPRARSLAGKAHDITIAAGEVFLHKGSRFDTSSLKDPESNHIKKFKKKSGGLGFNSKGDFQGEIQLDTVIETVDHGEMTFEEYWLSDHGHLRAQSPFRDSTSQAAFLNKHKDGTPFLHDAGCKYVSEDVPSLLQAQNYGTNIPADYLCTVNGVSRICKDSVNQAITSTPIYVVANSHNEEEENYGKVMLFRTLKGTEVEKVIPSQHLLSDRSEVPSYLASFGLGIIDARGLMTYLKAFKPMLFIRSASKTGWVGDSFVLPTQTIRDPAGERILFGNGQLSSVAKSIKPHGSLEEWQQGMKDASDMVIFGVCAALSAPVRYKVGIESGGFHFYGQTSQGKTTLLQAIASVWGNGADPQRSGGQSIYLQKWNSTANAMEATAEQFNDLPLIIDEIGESDPKTFAQGIYRLASGVGKSRADVLGGRKDNKSWRNLLFSAGEVAVEQFIKDSGNTVKGGHLVRLTDIDITGAGSLFKGATEADTMKDLCGEHYGLVGPAFIAAVPDLSHQWGGMNHEEIGPADSPIAKRVRKRFSVVFYSGCLASKAGLLPWSTKQIEDAIKRVYASWSATSDQISDDVRGMKSLRDYISQYDARFERPHNEHPIHNRAGWYRDGIYYFTPAAFKEACGGANVNQVKKLLHSKKYQYLHTNRTDSLNVRFKTNRRDKGVQTVAVKQKIQEE